MLYAQSQIYIWGNSEGGDNVNKKIVIGIALILVIIAATTIYFYIQSQQPKASEAQFRKGDFTSEPFQIDSDEWYLSWEIKGDRSSESYFTHEIYREGEQTPIDVWTVSSASLTSSSGAIQGRSNDIAGPGTFYFKIYASSDFSWLVYPSER